MNCIGKKNTFAIEYCFMSGSNDTELAMYVGGKNILSFIRDGKEYTTCWNIDEIVLWLRNFINDMVNMIYSKTVKIKFFLKFFHIINKKVNNNVVIFIRFKMIEEKWRLAI